VGGNPTRFCLAGRRFVGGPNQKKVDSIAYRGGVGRGCRDKEMSSVNDAVTGRDY